MKNNCLLFLLTFLPLWVGAENVRTIHVEKAGTLSSYISDDEKYQIEKLTLTGVINGEDLGFLREMAGGVRWSHTNENDFFYGSSSKGSLSVLDLSGVELAVGGEYASVFFDGADSYSKYELDNSDEIPSSAFYRCLRLTSVTIPNSVTSIGSGAFSGCSSLTSVTIPNSVTSIGAYAFQGCECLNSVTIPNSVASIGMGAFSGTPWDENLPGGVVYAGKVLYKYKGTMPSGTEISVKDGTLGISGYAFSGCSGMTSITIPNSVTSIGGAAFNGCSGLTSITIPNSVTSIDGAAFSSCSGLTSITIPNSVMSIGSRAFDGTPWYENQPDGVVYAGKVLYKYKGTMPSGTEISVKDGTLGIGGDAFSRCSGLTSVSIPNSVKSIGGYAFSSCSGLTSVTIPNSVTSIGGSAFQNCTGLATISIPNSVTSIGASAFYGCNSLSSITIPNSVTSIGQSAFRDCRSLTSLSIPGSVIYIGAYAFNGCSGLTSMETPNSVTYIGSFAFYNCTNLTSVNIHSGVTIIGQSTFQFCRSLSTIIIPSSVTLIRESAFSGCSGLTSVSIPNSVKSIDGEAFYRCSSLSSVMIPNSVTSIGVSAFKGCTSLTSVTIPNSMTSIGANAFSGCSSLSSITIPNSVTSIGGAAFDGCSGLTSIKVESENPVFDSRNNCNAIIESSSNTIILGCKNTFIPNSVTSIGGHAFYGCSSLTSVTIPNSVTSIGAYAFSGCSSLSSITIPNSVTSIGSSAFDNTAWYNNQPDGVVYAGKVLYKYKGTMPSGTKISIKDGTCCINSRAFSGCSGMTSVTIPTSVTSIGASAFYRCSSLTSVTIPNSVTSIGDHAFNGCTSLTSVSIPNSVTSIGSSAFDNTAWYNNQPDGVVYAGKMLYKYKGTMPSGTEINVKDGTLGIALNAFRDCSGLTSITIPSSVTSIDIYAFYGCSSLTSVYCLAEQVPQTDALAFGRLDYEWQSSAISNATLYVPGGSIEAYKAASPWNSFKDIAEIVGVQLNKTEASLLKGKTLTLKYTVYPLSTDQSVTWKSSNTKVATVSSAGKVTGVKTGMVTITCTSKATGLSATCKVTVGKLSLNKSKASIEKGKTVTLTATVNPTSLKDKSVIWKSSNAKVATVTSDGEVMGVKTGTATIICTSVVTGLSATCKVTVGKVSLNKSNIAIEKGKTLTLTPSIYPTTLSDKSVTWKSSDEAVATVTSDGLVKGVKTGVVTITCTSVATGLSASCTVTVGKINLSKSKATIEKGNTLTLTATVYPSTLTDKSVTWKSSDETVATVTEDGMVTGVKAGTATITCTSNVTGLSATCKVTITATSGTRSLSGDDDETTGIDALAQGETEPYDVYDLSGRMVLHQVTSLEGLSNGIYIVNGKKVLKK